MRNPESKLVSLDRLAVVADVYRARNETVVTTNGCFDLLHWGHVRSLSGARALGDVLVVGVNSDASVKRLKGPSRPIWDERTRALQLAGLEAVDWVVIFDEDTPERLLRAVKPHVHVKGADYGGRDIPEKKIVAEWGGQLSFIPLVEGYSTTSLIRRLQASFKPNLEK